MELIYIYTLTDPLTNEIRYVGKTTQSPIKRYLQHLNNSKKRKTYVNIWINDLLNDGLKPIIKVVDKCTDCNWIELEKRWTIKIYEENKKLCNLTYIDNKEDRDPNLSINTNGQRKKDKIYEEIKWLIKNTGLSSNDIIGLYGKSDWKKFKKSKYKNYRQKFFNNKKYGNMIELNSEIKKYELNDLEKFIWYNILHLKYSIPNETEYLKLLNPLIKKNGEFYDRLFYRCNETPEYFVSVLKEISSKLLSEKHLYHTT
jgi:hypothetical protein